MLRLTLHSVSLVVLFLLTLFSPLNKVDASPANLQFKATRTQDLYEVSLASQKAKALLVKRGGRLRPRASPVPGKTSILGQGQCPIKLGLGTPYPVRSDAKYVGCPATKGNVPLQATEYVQLDSQFRTNCYYGQGNMCFYRPDTGQSIAIDRTCTGAERVFLSSFAAHSVGS